MKKEKVLLLFAKLATILIFLIGIICLMSYLAGKEIWQLCIGIFLLAISLGFLFKGLKSISEEERWVIEVFGRFYTILGPGLNWIFPFLMKVRAVVPIWRLPIGLFPDKPRLDFKRGGKAQLIDCILWGRVIGAKEKDEKKIRENVYKMIYEIENWEKASREETELRFRSVLNNLTVEEALETIHTKKTNWWEIVKTQFSEIVSLFEGYGFEGDEITMSDFDWSKEVDDIRERLYEQERKIRIAELAATAAEFEATVKALGIGGVIARIRDSLIKDLKYSEQEAKRLAPQVYNFVKAADTGSLFLTRLHKGDGLGPLITEMIATISATQKKVGGKPEREKKTSKE